MRLRMLALPIFASLCLPCFPLDTDTMETNTWYLIDARDAFLESVKSNAEASFSTRGWCKMVKRPVGGVMMYEGFYDQSRGMTIYANALYWFNPITEVCSMLVVSNWQLSSTPLPENTAFPTPVDRHTYNQFCYAASSNSVYLMGGANQGAPGGHPVDAWGFSITNSAWTKIADTCPGFAGYNGDFFDNPLEFSPVTGELLLFKSAGTVHAYHLGSGLWSVKSTPANAGATGLLGTGNTYDPVRNRVLFYGGAWTDNQNALKTYYPSENRYETISPSGALPPATDYSNISYAKPWDVYFTLANGQTWYFSPVSNGWTQLTTGGVSVQDIGMYSAYDSVNNLLVAFDLGSYGSAGYFNARFFVLKPELTPVSVESVTPARHTALEIAPNPLSVTARLSLKGAPGAECRILNVRGKTVAEFTLRGQGAQWDASRLPAGVYTAAVKAGGKTLIRKAVIIR